MKGRALFIKLLISRGRLTNAAVISIASELQTFNLLS
jgi:hypothetical protein